MDDEEVLRALPVARAASAWRHSKSDTEVYRRLVVATGEWDDYVAPQLDEPAASDVAAQLRRAARRALRADDEQATRARNVARAASAWLREPTAPEAYSRYVVAIDEWDDYDAPQLEEPVEELLDQLGDDSAPLALGELVADVTAQIRKAAGRAL